MLLFLVITSIVVACAEDPEVEAAESGVFLRDDELHRQYESHRDDRTEHHGIRYDTDDTDRRQSYRVNLHDDEDFRGPEVFRSTSPHDSRKQQPDIVRQNKIIADVFSPDYYQPTWILDYRYLKTGGRDYTRGPGGQILILPKNIHTDEHKEFRDYDSLLEHLRLKNLAERNEMRHRYTAKDKKEEIIFSQEHMPKSEPRKTQDHVMWKPNNYHN